MLPFQTSIERAVERIVLLQYSFWFFVCGKSLSANNLLFGDHLLINSGTTLTSFHIVRVQKSRYVSVAAPVVAMGTTSSPTLAIMPPARPMAA